jgi:hypothetical protein
MQDSKLPTPTFLSINSGAQPIRINDYINAVPIPVPTASTFGNLYKKPGSTGLYWKTQSGAEVNLTTSSSGSSPTASNYFKDACVVRTADPLDPYTASGSGVGKTLTAQVAGEISYIDGYLNLTVGDRILVDVPGVTDTVDVGIYTLTEYGSQDDPWVLTRATDFNSSENALPGSIVTVASGDVFAGVSFILSTQSPIIIDTTNLSFARYSAGYLNHFDLNLNGYSITSIGIGSVVNPSMRFGTASTGIYSLSSSQLDFATDGVNRLHLSTTGVNIPLKLTVGSVTPTTGTSVDFSSCTLPILPPKMDTTARNALSSTPSGAVIYDTTANFLSLYNGSAWNYLAPTSVLQAVYAGFSEVATGTTLMLDNNTIPQNTAGTQFMTISVTPKATTSRLYVQVRALFDNSISGTTIMALFQDSTADALATSSFFQSGGGGSHFTMVLTCMVNQTAGTAITFKIRAGSTSSSTLTFNGSAGSRLYGTSVKSTIKVTEYL